MARIGIISKADLSDPVAVNTYRGSGVFQAARNLSLHLSQKSELVHLGPLPQRVPIALRALNAVSFRQFSRLVYFTFLKSTAGKCARLIEQRLRNQEVDFLLCLESASAISQYRPKLPMVLWTDAPIGGLLDFYPHLQRLTKSTKSKIVRIEGDCLRRCALVIFTSEWAAENAIAIYGLEPSRVKVIHWGPNLVPSFDHTRLIDSIKKRNPTRVELIFIYSNFMRKGGMKALKVAFELEKLGIDSRLSLVGDPAEIPAEAQRLESKVRVLGYLQKSNLAQLRTLEESLAQSHFLLLPTQADCSPHVVAEANLYGVPALCSNVGGLSSLVKDRVNGMLFDSAATAREYAEYIAQTIHSPDRYASLCQNSMAFAQSDLSWESAVEQFLQTINGLEKTAQSSDAALIPHELQLMEK